MRYLIEIIAMILFISILANAESNQGKATTTNATPVCGGRLSTTELHGQMHVLYTSLKASKDLSLKKMKVQKALDQMNCQVDLYDTDADDDAAKWAALKYQDMLGIVLQSNCKLDRAQFSTQSAGAAQDDLSNEENSTVTLRMIEEMCSAKN